MTHEIIIGLITTLLGTIVALTWNTFLVPLIIENFGERVKLHRYWISNLDFGSGNSHSVKLELKKLGYNISGDLEFTNGKHAGKKYKIKGRFQSLILTFRYYPYDKHSRSQGTATLMWLKDGELLKGHFAYFSQDKELVDTVGCEFTSAKNK